jgi:hypothetical protein
MQLTDLSPAMTAELCLPGAGFTGFLGRWVVRRKILDRPAGSVQHFVGEACVEPNEFTEEGELKAGSSSFLSRRTYRLVPQGETLSVRFPDGRDFIALGSEGRQAVHHDCDADTYQGLFFFRGTDYWAEFWRVTGPRKDYVYLGHFARIGFEHRRSD